MAYTDVAHYFGTKRTISDYPMKVPPPRLQEQSPLFPGLKVCPAANLHLWGAPPPAGMVWHHPRCIPSEDRHKGNRRATGSVWLARIVHKLPIRPLFLSLFSTYERIIHPRS